MVTRRENEVTTWWHDDKTKEEKLPDDNKRRHCNKRKDNRRQHEKMTTWYIEATIKGISDNMKKHTNNVLQEVKKIGSTTKLQYYARIPTLNYSI